MLARMLRVHRATLHYVVTAFSVVPRALKLHPSGCAQALIVQPGTEGGPSPPARGAAPASGYASRPPALYPRSASASAARHLPWCEAEGGMVEDALARL